MDRKSLLILVGIIVLLAVFSQPLHAFLGVIVKLLLLPVKILFALLGSIIALITLPLVLLMAIPLLLILVGGIVLLRMVL